MFCRGIRAISILSLFLLQDFPLSSLCAERPPVEPSAADVEKFLRDAEARLNELAVKSGRASWVQDTYITDDTEALAADANEEVLAAVADLAKQAKRFEGLELSPALSRKLMLLKLRQDWKQQQGKAFSLRSFHDILLGNGTAPFWLHRQLMLADDHGDVLE